ncbi:unnamed protein product [Ilex paraguariensis]|uniref:HTH myb-type domain-containing protein n=1 Tax=Ilex paraguariensis TaxID=185542 RepID=A0ABC8V592_9AQUA
MLINNNNHSDYTEKMQRYQERIQALEEEKHKIQVFQRELPLCLELVTQTIEACRQQLSGTTVDYFHGQCEYSEQTSSEEHVLEEFIPIKRILSSDEDEQKAKKSKNNGSDKKNNKNNDKSSKKSDWLKSVQLWNHPPDPPTKEKSTKKLSVKRKGTAPPSMDGSPSSMAPIAAASSTADTGGSGGGRDGSKREEKEGKSEKKARRCWSPELHRRFLQALQQLGGAHVATPKQIRELMKVDELSNDEVKSHLQKYRLHMRRPSSSMHNYNNSQAPQFIVVGGIWVPPEYAAMTAKTASEEAPQVAASHGIYAPIAALPSPHQDASTSLKQRQQQNQLEPHGRGSNSEGKARSNSPATSSSTHTIALPAD